MQDLAGAGDVGTRGFLGKSIRAHRAVLGHLRGVAQHLRLGELVGARLAELHFAIDDLVQPRIAARGS